MVNRGQGSAQPWYYYAVVFMAAVLIFAQGYNLYHRSVGPTDGAAWSADGVIGGVEPGGPAERAGLRIGDKIIALDGVADPEQLRRRLVSVSDTYRVGDRHRVTVLRQGQPRQSEYQFEYQVDSNYRDFVHLMAQMFGNLVALAFLAIGLGVFLIKPRDPQVLRFCLAFAGVSTFFGTIFPVYLRRLPLGFGHLIWFVQTTLQVFALPLLLHFFLTFPAPIGLIKRWPRLATSIYIPAALILPLAVISALPLMYTVDVPPRLQAPVSQTTQAILAIILLAASGVALAINYRAMSSPDHRRRMRVLMGGFIVGFIPLAWQLFRQDPSPLFTTEWEAVAGLIVLFVPLSFAYAIIKHRLFDLRLVIRRSLQYALARHVLFAALVSPLALLVIDVIVGNEDFLRQYLQAEFPRIGLYLLIGTGLISVHRPLMNWLDRKFFREAYDARKILSGLAEEIGLIVDINELTSMVMKQINDSLHIKYGALLLRQAEGDQYHCAHYLGARACTIKIPATAYMVRELRRRPWRPLELRSGELDDWDRGLSPEAGDFLRETDIDLVIPLRVSRDLIGLMLLGEKQSEEPYSREDRELLMTVAAQTALGVERARLSAEMAKEERLKREVEIAQEVQSRLFPQSAPCLATLEIAGVCLPAQGVAGDYYDFLPLAPGRLGVAIGDISGKGISAALLMANLQATLRSQAALAGDEVARLLGGVNSHLFHSTSRNKFATLFYATYDDATRRLTYVNAGHNGPLLVRGQPLGGAPGPTASPALNLPTTSGNLALAPNLEAGCPIQRLETGGMIIGAFESPVFEQETVRLDTDDVLVAYTDGVVEAQAVSGEAFGEERLEQLILQHRGRSASELVDVIVKTVSEFTSGAEQHDDVTLVVMKVL